MRSLILLCLGKVDNQLFNILLVHNLGRVLVAGAALGQSCSVVSVTMIQAVFFFFVQDFTPLPLVLVLSTEEVILLF